MTNEIAWNEYSLSLIEPPAFTLRGINLCCTDLIDLVNDPERHGCEILKRQHVDGGGNTLLSSALVAGTQLLNDVIST